MLNFRKIIPADRPILEPYLRSAGNRACEDTFPYLCLWGEQNVCTDYDVPLIFGTVDHVTSYALPLRGDRAALIELLRRDAQARGIPFRLYCLLKDDLDLFETAFPGRFRFLPVREYYDYIYSIDRLCDLHGKSLQSKRNFCNRFEAEHPDYRLLPLTGDLLPRCAAFTSLWYERHGESGEDYREEQTALERAFADFDALGLEGAVIEDGGMILAYAIGSRISDDTFGIHFEKAMADVPGAYPIINREYARSIRKRHPDVRLLNREDDMGLPGLRKAKESYQPDILLEKWLAEEIV